MSDAERKESIMASYPIYRESDLHQTEFRNFDEALMPATVLYHPSGIYNDHRRMWQGIPGIERTKNGRLFVGFYGGMSRQLRFARLQR